MKQWFTWKLCCISFLTTHSLPPPRDTLNLLADISPLGMIFACEVGPAQSYSCHCLTLLLLRTESSTSATAISNPRLLVAMGSDSGLEIVEEYAPGPGDRIKYFTNTVTEVDLGEGAELRHG